MYSLAILTVRSDVLLWDGERGFVLLKCGSTFWASKLFLATLTLTFVGGEGIVVSLRRGRGLSQ